MDSFDESNGVPRLDSACRASIRRNTATAKGRTFNLDRDLPNYGWPMNLGPVPETPMGALLNNVLKRFLDFDLRRPGKKDGQ